MIKIWQKTSEGKSSWPALLGAVLSVFCCFLFSGNAKAAVEIGNYTSGGANLSSNPVIATSTIPVNCANPLVVFQILLDYSSGQITSILWDDETTANNIPNQALFTGNYFADYIYYATSTTPGDDITFYFNRNSTGGWWNYAITTFCGVDQNNPVGNLVKKEGNLDYNNILTATSTESSSAIYAAYFKIASYHQTWLGISPNDFTEQARTGLDWMSSFTALDLPGEINGDIYDYDVNFTNNNQIYGNWTFAALPINGIIQPSCAEGFISIGDYCVLQDSIIAGYFYPLTPYTCIKNQPCNLTYYYNIDYVPQDTNTMNLYFSSGTSSNFIASSSIINVEETNTMGGISYFQYTFTKEGKQEAYFKAQADDQEANNAWIYASKINILVASSSDDIGNIEINQFIKKNNHDLACSAEDWEEAASSTWQNIICSSIKTGLDLGDSLANVPKNFIDSIKNILLTIFPLNIPTNIIEQWNLSEGKNLPTGLEMLTPQDSEGNIYITLSPELAGATSTIQIWGEEIYYATPGLETFFNFIKEFTRILLWLLVLVEIIGIGFQILHDINHEEDPDFELTSIHYDEKGRYSASYRPKK